MKNWTVTPAERVRQRLKVNPDTGCHEWQGVLSGGYGQISINGVMVGTHVVVFEEAHGYRPPYVMHKCDNRPCCRLDHLVAGTPKRNTQDMWGKGRQGLVSGPSHPANKLTGEAVLAIREALLQCVAAKSLAKQYGVSTSVIYDIKSGKRYKWAHPEGSGELSS